MQNDIRRRPEGALMRTYLAAAGLSPDSIGKPLIGVVTSSTQVFSERPGARELGNAVIAGIETAGGVAVRWDTARTPELMAWGHADSYSFAWRDQIADFIESWSRQEAMDGLVLVGDSPETLAGMTMAAARLNGPAVIVPAGAARWEYKKIGAPAPRKTDSLDPFELLCATMFAKKRAAADIAPAFTACMLAQDNHASHAMDLALEALGACLPGTSTASAACPRRQELARASGQRVVALVKSGFLFRRVLSGNAFSNAIRLSAALGGCVDVAVHLMAIAHEAGLNLSLDQFDRIARETPQLCRLGGVGDKAPHRIEDLDRAGGVWAVLHVLKDKILPAATISSKGALELAKSTSVKDTKVIAAHRPYRAQSGVGVVHGNLAPNGAVFLVNQAPASLSSFQGAAVVFESEVEAARAVVERKVKKGSAIVVRGQGPKGGPGLRSLRILPALLESEGLNKSIPVITDGRLPDTPVGLFLAMASPEGVTNGPLAVLRTGDKIDIDLGRRLACVRLTDMELRVRLARWQRPEIKATRGFLGRYSRSVSEAREGAVLK